MNTEPAKRYWRGLNPDEQITAALSKGLSKDKSDVNSNPIYKKLNKQTSQPQYDALWDFWKAYVDNIFPILP